MGHPSREILCIDDDEQSLKVRTIALEAYGYQVRTESDAQSGLRALAQHDIAAVIMDYQMPGMDGGKAAVEMKRLRPHIPVMILSALPWLPDSAPVMAIDMFVQKGEPLTVLAHRIEEMIAASDRRAALQPAPSATTVHPLKKAILHKRIDTALPAPARKSKGLPERAPGFIQRRSCK